ncbi:DUF2959 family protein [Geobacter sp. SVR]|uniref:DUF2959 family protein n=1 Tax=Geobacter sp. SVR TaxID=2495594 RepID=UPI00143EF6D0|nr:DUF2959 family protein [Geobacter sp. SVR]BCS53549.1 hypothetical protein GSVR_18570 [Geobacter sp. SVR]GCF84254.1 hypothetical protein GSbR_08540 [Geobacter sp. SVR]
MKYAVNTVAVIASMMLAGLTGLSGCATTGMERSVKATDAMQVVENDYKQINSQVDVTNSSLQDLISPNQTDMKRALEYYKTNVDKMEKLAKDLEKNTDKMASEGLNYFTEWEKQGNTYTDPQFRDISEKRRTEQRNNFTKIPEASADSRRAIQTYVADAKNIHKYLSNDLTPKGVEAVTPLAKKTIQEGEEVKTATKPVVATIDRTRNAMAQGGMASGAAAGAAAGGQVPESKPVEQQQQPQPKSQE